MSPSVKCAKLETWISTVNYGQLFSVIVLVNKFAKNKLQSRAKYCPHRCIAMRLIGEETHGNVWRSLERGWLNLLAESGNDALNNGFEYFFIQLLFLICDQSPSIRSLLCSGLLFDQVLKNARHTDRFVVAYSTVESSSILNNADGRRQLCHCNKELH